MKPEYEKLRSELIAKKRAKISNGAELGDNTIVRGECKPFTEAAIAAFPHLVKQCGFYLGHEHWWAEDHDGTIVDFTWQQFTSTRH